MKIASSAKDFFSIEDLVGRVSEEVNGILRTNLYEAGLSENELDRLKTRKLELREALKNCGVGDKYAKKYIKHTIKEILLSKILKNVTDYDSYIYFGNAEKLTYRDKFDIILYLMFLENGQLALEKFLDDFMENMEGNILDVTCVTGEYVDKVYDSMDTYLSAADKLEIIVQRVYGEYKGLGVIDEIRDMKIEGVSSGVSGDSNGPSSVWVMHRGVNIHLSFLKFETVGELERVCMNIYRYGSPGQLSKSKGYIVNEMKDNSRVVVVRPPFAENFAFFVRKFDTIENKQIPQLITDKGTELVEEILRYIVRGCQVSAITGAQGSGKTTLLMSMIGFIPGSYTLRIQEQAFELHLRDIYPMRNILTFRETEYVSGQEGLDIQKKTDGVVNILGEVASNEVAAWLIQMSQVGSLFTLFTHHAKTTESLIKYMRNALIINGNFNNERIALEQVVEAIRFDIHMEKDGSGHRYIERISEIVQTNDSTGYVIRNIVQFDGEKYILKDKFSDMMSYDIAKHLVGEERESFNEKFGVQA